MTVDWKSLPSLSALRAFDAVARAGDFSSAARMLNVTHAAISQQVRGLERELGVTLAQRAGRSITLTEAGTELACALGDSFEGMQRGVQAIRGQQAGRGLRVATTPFIVDSLILPRLSEFWDAHPGVEVALKPDVRYVDLVAEGFDLGLRAGPHGRVWPGMDTQLLSHSRGLVVSAPGLVAEQGTDPLTLPWVWTDEMPGEIAVLRDAGVDIDTLQKVEVGSAMLHWQATLRGQGVSLASDHVARDDIAAGRLQELCLTGIREGD